MWRINILDLLFPNKCMMCDVKINNTNKFYSLCDKCIEKINIYRIKYEEKVPEFLKNINEFYCLFEYRDEIRDIILNYKFNGEIWRGKYFARLLYDYMERHSAFDYIDMITYVPVNDKSMARRGYDQVYEISAEISKISKILLVDCFKKNDKIKDNAAENKSRIDRLNEKKYTLLNNIDTIKGKNILLIDDVLTTGATINECVKLLNENGAKNIYVAILATGRKDI